MEAFHPKFNMARRNNTWDMATRLLFAVKQSGIRNSLFDNGLFEKIGFVESNKMLNLINLNVYLLEMFLFNGINYFSEK